MMLFFGARWDELESLTLDYLAISKLYQHAAQKPGADLELLVRPSLTIVRGSFMEVFRVLEIQAMLESASFTGQIPSKNTATVRGTPHAIAIIKGICDAPYDVQRDSVVVDDFAFEAQRQLLNSSPDKV